LRKTKQFKANGKPGYKFCSPVAQVGDRIVDIVLQSTASGDAFVEFPGVGLENHGCFPTAIEKYLNVTIHSSL
jgi:DNA-binding sugar fermentation-stimulating protein